MGRTTADRARRGTYSIVARDPDSGEFGVAVQSHWFSVGPIVPWARAGVGAVATQANALVSYGPRAIELMADGADADGALRGLLAADAGAQSRQVAVVDALGGVAAHTGSECMAYAGHVTGAGVSCQANIMATATVWDAMLSAYLAASGPLAQRLITALEAGEAAGGDLRGSQSAAVLVVPASGEWWETSVSLRVEDDDAPLAEMRRLLRLDEAYALASEADGLVGLGRHDEASALYQRSSALAPDNHELMFWSGLGKAQAGDLDGGTEQVRAAIALQPTWAELLTRLTPSASPVAATVAQRLGL